MGKIKLALYQMRHLSVGMILIDFIAAVGLSLLQTDPGMAIWLMFPTVLLGNFIGCLISVCKKGEKFYG